MAQKLRLKSQKYSARQNFSYAINVLVDTGVAHLSDPYTYAVSDEDGEIFVGSLVTVPFGNKSLMGIVISANANSQGNFKFIKKVIHRNPVINDEQIELLVNCKDRWTGSFWSYLKFTVPHIPMKYIVPTQPSGGIKRKVEAPELRIGNKIADLYELIENRITPARQLLILVPDEKILEVITREISQKYLSYGTHLSSAERVENYLAVLSGKVNLIIGTRSAIFLPLNPDAEIIVVEDLSFSYYESRFPYWNVRDVALLRAQRHSVTFFSFSPSLELVRLVEEKWMRAKVQKANKTNLHFKNGRIGYQSVVKSGLRAGPVLVLIPEKGYVNTLVCSKCRNIYKCPICGGRLNLPARNAHPVCKLCHHEVKSDRCEFCGIEKFLNFGKGIEKAIEEIGKQFPNTVIEKVGSESKKYLKGQIVVANYSELPLQKFAAVIALDFGRYGYQNGLRSSELSRKTLFNIRALEPLDFFIDVEYDDYFSQVMQMSDSYRSALRELGERSEALLPPNYRIAIIECDSKSATVLKEQPFIVSVSYASGRAIVKTKIEKANELSNFLQGVARYRSMKRLKPWNVKIDPLDI